MRDPQELARLHAVCFDTPRPWSASEFTQLLEMPGVFLCPHPNGFLMGRVVLDEAELLTVAVDPDHRMSGTGTMLVESFLTKSAAMGAATAFLEVSAENIAAIRLYEKMGFATVGRRKAYYHTPDGRLIDALVLSRSV